MFLGSDLPVVVRFRVGVGHCPSLFVLFGINAGSVRIGGQGAVVFAPTYGTDITTQEGVDRAAVDAECGYRFARSIAAEYGGDLDQPVTFVGWSLGD